MNIIINAILPIDNVSGYSSQKCFNALDNDVKTIPEMDGAV
jgi:hypothetical protein